MIETATTMVAERGASRLSLSDVGRAYLGLIGAGSSPTQAMHIILSESAWNWTRCMAMVHPCRACRRSRAGSL